MGLSKEHEYWHMHAYHMHAHHMHAHHMHAHHILALSFPLHSSQIPAS